MHEGLASSRSWKGVEVQWQLISLFDSILRHGIGMGAGDGEESNFAHSPFPKP